MLAVGFERLRVEGSGYIRVMFWAVEFQLGMKSLMRLTGLLRLGCLVVTARSTSEGKSRISEGSFARKYMEGCSKTTTYAPKSGIPKP